MYSIHLLFDEPNNNKNLFFLCQPHSVMHAEHIVQEGGMNKIAVKHKYFNKDTGITYLYILLE